MFEIGFTELLIVGVVALVVLGPERLPRAARMLGLALRRARAHWHSVKADLERELAAEELRRSLHEARAAGDGLRRELRDAADAAARDLDPDATADGRPPRGAEEPGPAADASDRPAQAGAPPPADRRP
jgi:sec-independent protein translocase protein TatB